MTEGDVDSQRRDAASQPSWEGFIGTFDPLIEAGNSSSPVSGNTPSQKQTKGDDKQDASQRLATFPLRNTSDAMRLLDQAEAKSDNDVSRAPDGHHQRTADGSNPSGIGHSTPEFFLIQEGYISETALLKLFRVYTESVHPIMPVIPYNRMPISSEGVLSMANQEPHFFSAILVVTTSLLGYQDLHDILWRRVQILFSDVVMKGKGASVGAIEGLILLSGTVDERSVTHGA